MRCLFACLLLCFAFSTHASEIDLVVNLSGLPKSIETQIIDNLRIAQSAEESKLSRTRVYNLHYLAEEQIEKILQSFGYYHSHINSELKELEHKMIASYSIQLGPPTLIRHIDYRVVGAGQDHPKFSKLPSSKLQVSKRLMHKHYEDTKEAIISRFVADGYLDASFITSEIRVNIEQQRADIILLVDSGPQYIFGPVIFVETDYNTEMLKRYVPFYQGEPYSQKQLSSLRKNLFKADLFSKIQVKPEKNIDTPINDVNILVKTQSRPINHYFGKFGYYTDSHLNAELGWHRRIKPQGHHLKLSGSASQVLQQANALYQIPGRHAATDTYEFGGNLRREKFDERFSQLMIFDAAKVHKRSRLRTQLGLTYHQELFHQPSDDKEVAKLIIPNIRFTWVNQLNDMAQGSGQKIDFSAKSAIRALFSSTDFLKLKFHAHINHNLSDNTTLSFKGTIGTIYAHEFTRKFPTSIRFYTGGDRTVRGFRYRSLGPKRINTKGKEINIGGRHLLLGSIELERRIWKDVGMAAFFDAGNALEHWNDSLARAAGLGLRYHTALGPFRLDVAKPLSDHGKRNLHFHLTFGWDL